MDVVGSTYYTNKNFQQKLVTEGSWPGASHITNRLKFRLIFSKEPSQSPYLKNIKIKEPANKGVTQCPPLSLVLNETELNAFKSFS